MKNETVLITGASGSIGSALARKIFEQKPKKLILLDNNETGLFEIQQELKGIDAIVASIRDEERLADVFKRFKPTVVFHVAAYKHVPLMEDHPIEAIKTNIGGLINVATTSVQNNVKRFVFISSDKAADPVSIMGLTKKYGEKLCKSFASISKTKCVVVRFGNVMNSRGSVIPIWNKQIAEGKPVTVTTKDMQRYFMGIYEAVDLILEAAESKEGVYLLDMGDPIRIYDLAQLVVKMSGKDVPIVITGNRGAEKIFERLHDPKTETTIKRGKFLEVKEK